ncbi:MAG: J domain-containing protein [Candidatus Anammoxibacter sp.]
MSLFKRIFNIIQADVSGILGKIEKNQAKRKHGTKDSNYEWDNFKDNYNKNYNSSDNRKDSSNNIKYTDNKLARYYANLEVPYGSDLEIVKKSWKRLLKKCHPDLYTNDPAKKDIAHDLASKLNEAYREVAKSKGI